MSGIMMSEPETFSEIGLRIRRAIQMSGMPSADSIIHSGLPSVVLLFVLTHLATHYGRKQKLQIADTVEKNGRNAAQVVANLGIAALSASVPFWIFRAGPGPQTTRAFFELEVPMLAALAEATADTVSSEIGQALGGRPFLIPSFKRVPPGTDGAISTVGTLAGLASAAAIAGTGSATLELSGRAALVAWISGTAGLFFDSVLGATAERRGWIGNDVVNFASTAFAAALAWSLLPGVAG